MNTIKFGLWPLALLFVMPLTGCVSTAPISKINETLICEQGKCTRIGKSNRRASLLSVKKLFSDGLTVDFQPCEANPLDAKCTGDDLGFLVFAGVVPGRAALKAINVRSITNDTDPNKLKLRISDSEWFLGTPLLCMNADATLSISNEQKLILEVDAHYCNWAVIGNILTTFSMVIDKVDTSSRMISGYYSIGVTGTGNGKGSGYASFKVPDTRLDSDVLTELDELKKSNESKIDSPTLAGTRTNRLGSGVEKKVALVIGNSAYKLIPLDNTRNDAEAMSSALAKIGFDVVKLTDADFAMMSKGVKEFMLKSQTSSMSLIFYAGHGVEIDGQNYLVSTDVDIRSPQNVLSRSINVTEMMVALGSATNKPKILILDACRDNPFPEKFKRQQQGLAQIEAPIESFIAFSTSPGKVAEDGAGQNSPYTKSLISKLMQPNVTIESVFRDVRKAVVSETNGRQTPWENTSLTTEVSFNEVN